MTSGPGTDGPAPLRALAVARPDLAGRIERILSDLPRLRAAAAEPDPGRAEHAVRRLVDLGALDDRLVEAGAGPARLSTLAHLALEEAVGPDFAPPRLLVGNAAVELAEALGRTFEPAPPRLLHLFGKIPDGEWDLPQQVAWLAARRGGDALVEALAGDPAGRPEEVLDLLEAALEAERHGPYRGAPPPAAEPSPDTGPPTGEVPIPAFPHAPAPAPGFPPVPAAPPGDDAGPPPLPSLPPVQRHRPAGRVRPGLPNPGKAVRRWVGKAIDAARRPTTRSMPPAPVPMAPPPEAPPEGPAPAAVVSTGFATGPGRPGLAADRTLARGRRYQFFVEIGTELAPDTIDTIASPLPQLPAGTVLQVALFGFAGELAPEPGADVGELRLVGDGTAVVETQPGGGATGRRLHLSVTTPDRVGPARMRCNLYCRQVLLQSRLIEVRVTEAEESGVDGGLRSELDFAVVSQLRAEHVEALEPRTLSLLLNDNGNGTHGFRFFAGTEFKHDATLRGDVLTATLEKARAALRLASWATPTEPARADFETLKYRYAEPGEAALAQDLAVLARSGFVVWDQLVDQLAGGAVADLVQRMRAPGVVELANKESLDLVVPAACIYDHPLNPEDAALAVCPAFLAARGRTPLDATPCFQGRCPSYDDPTVVCPSGFWGFRHQIGYSASLTGGQAGDARDQALTIPAGAEPVFTVGASQDAGLEQRDAHLERLRALAGDQWHFAWSRTDLFGLFRSTAPSVVYLYGHGGRQGQSPVFEVGSELDGPIVRASLRGKADWRASRPLVFLNGCHSAALAPDAAFSYATGFLQTAHASAVVGTEIAVFEKLAVAFAEECLRRFVAERQALGQAVRGARLALLEQGIPLGLVYVAFGPAELRLAA